MEHYFNGFLGALVLQEHQAVVLEFFIFLNDFNQSVEFVSLDRQAMDLFDVAVGDCDIEPLVRRQVVVTGLGLLVQLMDLIYKVRGSFELDFEFV